MTVFCCLPFRLQGLFNAGVCAYARVCSCARPAGTIRQREPGQGTSSAVKYADKVILCALLWVWMAAFQTVVRYPFPWRKGKEKDEERLKAGVSWTSRPKERLERKKNDRYRQSTQETAHMQVDRSLFVRTPCRSSMRNALRRKAESRLSKRGVETEYKRTLK